MDRDTFPVQTLRIETPPQRGNFPAVGVDDDQTQIRLSAQFFCQPARTDSYDDCIPLRLIGLLEDACGFVRPIVVIRDSRPIDVYAENRTFEHLYRVYGHIFAKEKNVNDSFVATLVPHVLDATRPLDLHGLRWTPIRLLHGRLPILGYRIEAVHDGRLLEAQPSPLPLAYCTDVSAIPPESWRALEGLGTLVLDMLRYRKHPTHFSVDQAVEAAHQIGAGRTFFIHMTHDIRHADLDARLPEGMSLSYDGLVID